MVPSVPTQPTAGTSPVAVNHILPSGSATMSLGLVPTLRPAVKRVIWPAGVTLPIEVRLPAEPGSVNQRLPSAPLMIVSGWL